MDAVEKELLRADLDALVGAIEEERFRHVAGIEAAPSLVAAFQRRGRAAHRDTVAALRSDGDEDLARCVAALRGERAQAAEEEAWRAAEVGVTAVGPDGRIRLEDAQLAIVRERDRDRRLAVGRAVAAAAALGLRDAALEKRARARAEVGLTPDWERVVAADALLETSTDGYRDVLQWTAHREAEVTPAPRGDMTRADLLYVLALHSQDGHFPPGMLAITLERTLAPLRLDLARVRVDEGKRAAQWPGAHAFGSRVSFRRQGGAADWLALFDAVGQALATAQVPPHRREPSARYTFGALLSGLFLDRRFLVARLGVDPKHAPDVVRVLALRQLFRLRANAAALRVASEVERGLSGAAWHDAHRDALTLATAATWPAGLAARDGDASALAAMLTGAARAERLRRSLLERCDEDWWKNPRAGDALGTVLAAGGMGEPDGPPLALAAEALVDKLQ